MLTMKNLSFIGLFIMLFASCQKADEFNPSANEFNSSADERAVERVFKATLQSSVNPDPEPTPCSGDLEGLVLPDQLFAGKATHLGLLKPDLSTTHHDACNLSFGDAELTTVVSGQLAAANGDLVYYTGLDTIDLTILMAGGTTGTITGTWTITGGTGRFEEASGSFRINGPVDFVTGTFGAEALGTIKY